MKKKATYKSFLKMPIQQLADAIDIAKSNLESLEDEIQRCKDDLEDTLIGIKDDAQNIISEADSFLTRFDKLNDTDALDVVCYTSDIDTHSDDVSGYLSDLLDAQEQYKEEKEGLVEMEKALKVLKAKAKKAKKTKKG